MVQEIVIGIIFLGALGYVGNLLYKNFQAKNACSSGCGKCNAADVEKIEAQLKEKAI